MVKTCRIKKYLKTIVELKLFERKLDFLKFIRKVKSRKLFENWNFEKSNLRNWSFENHLKIGVLKIRFKNWDFGN